MAKKTKREDISDTTLLDELEAACKVDKHDLDEGFRIQPDLVGSIYKLWESAKSDVRDIKTEIELAEAELYVQFKKQEEEDDEHKGRGASEKYINAKIYNTPRMTALVRKLAGAERRVGEVNAVREKVIATGYSLKSESDLYHDQYWQKEERGSKRRREALERETERQMTRSGRHMGRGLRDDDDE